MRLRRLDELPEDTVAEIDEALYMEMAWAATGDTTRPFDGYRQLQKELELLGVYSKGAATAPTSSSSSSLDGAVVLLEVPFPATFKKSLVGMELTSSELAER